MYDLLPAFVAHELSDDQRARLLEALHNSPELRRELERYRQLHLLLAAAAATGLSAPADLSSRIARQVAVRYYLRAAFDLAGELVATYAAATAFYAGLR